MYPIVFTKQKKLKNISKKLQKTLDFCGRCVYNISCSLRNCVRVAQQTLTLFVWVRILVPQPKKDIAYAVSFFIQSEGLVCNRRQAYVISSQGELDVIKASALYVFFFGLITYLSAKGFHPQLRCDCMPSVTDYIQGFALIVCLTAQ